MGCLQNMNLYNLLFRENIVLILIHMFYIFLNPKNNLVHSEASQKIKFWFRSWAKYILKDLNLILEST